MIYFFVELEVKNKPLTYWEKQFNKLIERTQFKVERTFGGIKR